MASREHTVWIWAAVGTAAGVSAWALHGFLAEHGDPSHMRAASVPQVGRADAPSSVAVGAAPSAPVAVSVAADRFKLIGMMLSGKVRVVLITVDGRPAQMFRVGEAVDGDIVVRDVSERGATLGPREGGVAIALELSQAPQPADSAPLPTARGVPQAPLADGSAESQELLRKIGAKNAPLSPQIASAPQKPAEGAAAPLDDGRWKPPGQQ